MSTWRVPRITSYEEGSPLCPIGLSSEQQDKGQQDTPKAVSPDVHPPQGLHPSRLRGSVCGQGTKPSKDTAFPSYPEASGKRQACCTTARGRWLGDGVLREGAGPSRTSPCWVQTQLYRLLTAPAGRKQEAGSWLCSWLSTPSPWGSFVPRMAGAGSKTAGTGTRPKDGKVGPSSHHAAKQNHVSVASLRERGLGKSIRQQRVGTSETRSLARVPACPPGQCIPQEAGTCPSHGVCFCIPVRGSSWGEPGAQPVEPQVPLLYS